jgi:hypothetical protein
MLFVVSLGFAGANYFLFYPIIFSGFVIEIGFENAKAKVLKAALFIGCLTWICISLKSDFSVCWKYAHSVWGFAQWKIPDSLKRSDAHFLSNLEYQGLVYIKDNTPPTAIIVGDRFGYSHEYEKRYVDRFFYYSTFSERQYFLEGTEFCEATKEQKLARKALVDTIYRSTSNQPYLICKQYNISYIIWSKRFNSEPASIKSGAIKADIAFENADIRVYKIL